MNKISNVVESTSTRGFLFVMISMDIKVIQHKNGKNSHQRHESKEKGMEHGSDVTGPCLVRRLMRLFPPPHPQSRERTCGWVLTVLWRQPAGELLFYDAWVVCDAQRAGYARAQLFPCSRFSISSPLHSPAISPSLTVFIAHRTCLSYLLLRSSHLYPLRGQIGIRTGGHSFFELRPASSSRLYPLWGQVGIRTV